MEIYLARQPIYDRSSHVVAYELLYRENAAATAAGGADADTMGSRVLVNALLGIGLERVTEGRTAFLNVSRELLLSGDLAVLSPSSVMLELLETVEPDAEVLAAASSLVDGGYTIALDDFEYAEKFDPLLRLADVVKLDVLALEGEALDRTVARLRPFGVRLLAEKVEDAVVHQRCMTLGFELFQGYHYSRPETLSRRDLSVEQLNIVRLLNILMDERTPDEQLEDIFREDVSLSYKLLRMVNSAAIAGRGVASIGHALRLLGRRTVHRWLALLLLASAADTPPRQELLRQTLVRARLAETAGAAVGRRRDGGALFLTGLLSMLDALLDMPMDAVLDRLDLAPEIQDALLRRAGPLAPFLGLMDAYESGRWADASRIAEDRGLAPRSLGQLYVDAVVWTSRRLPAH